MTDPHQTEAATEIYGEMELTKASDENENAEPAHTEDDN